MYKQDFVLTNQPNKWAAVLWVNFSLFLIAIHSFFLSLSLAQLAGAVEYTDFMTLLDSPNDCPGYDIE